MKLEAGINTLRSRMTPQKSPGLLERESTVSNNTSSREPVQVEPKTYFANERTFIQWISAALLLLTVSSIMMGSGNYNGTSSTIAFSALILVCYAAYTYFRRVHLLQSGQGYGYLDFLGPSILAAGVGFGVFIVFADAIKGSEFVPWGASEGKKDKDKYDYDDRRSLMALPQMMIPSENTGQQDYFGARDEPSIFPPLQESLGLCTRHSLQGVNVLEYQPRDIQTFQDYLLVATPQSLILHGKEKGTETALVLTEMVDVELQAIAWVGDDQRQLLALSTGPIRTELLVLAVSAGDKTAELVSRHVIHETVSQVGSMVVLPGADHRILLYLDGSMHTYQLVLAETKDDSSGFLVRTNSINMKVLNQGRKQQESVASHQEPDHSITTMKYFEGITYLLRSNENLVQAWDLNKGATLLHEWILPGNNSVDEEDRWRGMVLERRSTTSSRSGAAQNLLRGNNNGHPQEGSASSSSVYLHMPLDSYPPQLWSFLLQEQDSVLSLPHCDKPAVGTN